jgi:hypothetical protein
VDTERQGSMEEAHRIVPDPRIEAESKHRAEVKRTNELLVELIAVEHENGKVLARILDALRAESNLGGLRGQSPVDRR